MANYPLFIPSSAASLPTTTKGDLIVNNGSTNVRQAVGSNGTFLKANSSASTGIEWGSGSAILSVRNATTTDSPSVSTDDYIYCSGASFTITLPTAVGNTGKVFTFQHQGTSLSQVYTFNTTSAQTIGGYASGALAMYTNSEIIQVVSDGTNWRILEHRTTTGWTSAGAMTITATTSNPTKSSTVTVDDIAWRREGSVCEFWYRYTQTGTTGAANGSGDYIFGLPSNFTVDTTFISAYTTAPASGGFEANGAVKSHIDGTGWINNGTNRGDCQFFLYSTTSFRINTSILFASNAPWGSGRFNLAGSGLDFSAVIKLPISGWAP